MHLLAPAVAVQVCKIVCAVEKRAHEELWMNTSDGVNEAPALKKVNVGITVAGATAAAKGAPEHHLHQVCLESQASQNPMS